MTSGYKHYAPTSSAGGRRCSSASWTSRPIRARQVNGLCVPVDDARLAALDDRERNYERADVSAVVDARGGRVWAYIGARASRLRMRWAVAAATGR